MKKRLSVLVLVLLMAVLLVPFGRAKAETIKAGFETAQSSDEAYADKVMNDYIAANINDSMTDMEKLEKIAEFPCQYDYDENYKSVEDMVKYGGGNDLASSLAILKMCDKVGLEARERFGMSDRYLMDEYLQEGENHYVNVLAKIGDKFYIVDAGFLGKAPRIHCIIEVKTYELTNYVVLDNQKTAYLKTYKGLDKNIVLPSYVGDFKINGISDNCFRYRSELHSVVIPEGIVEIELNAFDVTGLQSVKIPEGVEEIGKNAFSSLFNYKDYRGLIYGKVVPLEIIELPASLKTLGADLSETAVLYHGTKEQWDAIEFLETYKAPKEGMLFCSNDGLAVSSQNLAMVSGRSKDIRVYTPSPNVSVSSSDTSVVEAEINEVEREGYFYREWNGQQVISSIRVLTVRALRDGDAVLTVSDGTNEVQIRVNVSASNEAKKPGKVKNLKLSAENAWISARFDEAGGAEGYEAAYSSAKDFPASKMKTALLPATGRIWVDRGKTYYVKVRAYAVNSAGKKVYGAYSAKKKIKVK